MLEDVVALFSECHLPGLWHESASLQLEDRGLLVGELSGEGLWVRRED